MRFLIIAAALSVSACATTPPPSCDLSAEDRAWIDASLDAWRFSAREITGVSVVRPLEAVFFDDDCVIQSANAFTADNAADVIWSTVPHNGEVSLPDGGTLPTGVTSFASADEARAFFVMSTPSVWRAAGVGNDALGLEVMMTGVLLHEGTHVAQSATYGARITAIIAANNLPDSFDDDAIQRRFEENTDFAASVERETELLFEAVAAPDQTAARRLAREALEMMRARQARWFVGPDAHLAEAENIWLTFEGSGQWVAYQWIVHPSGGGVDVPVATANFARRGRWWSQKEGIALALVLDRFGGNEWRRHALADGQLTLAEMLDAALSRPE